MGSNSKKGTSYVFEWTDRWSSKIRKRMGDSNGCRAFTRWSYCSIGE